MNALNENVFPANDTAAAASLGPLTLRFSRQQLALDRAAVILPTDTDEGRYGVASRFISRYHGFISTNCQ